MQALRQLLTSVLNKENLQAFLHPMRGYSLGNVQDIVEVLKYMPKNRHCLRSDALQAEPEKKT